MSAGPPPRRQFSSGSSSGGEGRPSSSRSSSGPRRPGPGSSSDRCDDRGASNSGGGFGGRPAPSSGSRDRYEPRSGGSDSRFARPADNRGWDRRPEGSSQDRPGPSSWRDRSDGDPSSTRDRDPRAARTAPGYGSPRTGAAGSRPGAPRTGGFRSDNNGGRDGNRSDPGSGRGPSSRAGGYDRPTTTGERAQRSFARAPRDWTASPAGSRPDENAERPKRLTARGEPGFAREWEARPPRGDSRPPSRGGSERSDRGSGGQASRDGQQFVGRPPRQQMADPVARKRVRLSESMDWDRDTNAAPVRVEVAEAAVVKRNRQRTLPDGISKNLQQALGVRRGGKVAEALIASSKAYERERYGEVLTILRPFLEEAPDAMEVRELYGLACYREGRWAEAIKHLTAFVSLSASVEQHPVLADAHRAMKHHTLVAELWEELAQSSPAAHLVAEGRIVMAGSLADQSRLAEAIALLERGALDSKRPKDHHMRMWYALADLYERAGDVARARERFQRIMQVDQSFVNVAERVANLG
jgi:tetratricopeptide (TPR) repeat protein